MILETGRVTVVEPLGLWVETIKRSTCNSCKAEKGCGQSLMAKWGGENSYLWVLLDGRDASGFHIGDEVKLGIPEEIIVKGTLLIYFLPLVFMLAAVSIVHHLYASDGITALSALIGLASAGLFLRWYSSRVRFDNRVQPVLVDDSQILHLASATPLY